MEPSLRGHRHADAQVLLRLWEGSGERMRHNERSFWNLYASCYDAITHLQPYQEMIKDVVAAIGLRPGMKILDAGCGTGNLECAIVKTGIPVEIQAVDASDSMLRRARHKNPDLRGCFREVDLTKPLPFEDQSFDLVVTSNVLCALPDAEATLREFRRVLKNDGRLVINDPKHDSRFMAIFWRHLFSGGSVRAFWRFAVLAGSVILIPELLFVGLANVVIELRNRQGRFTLRTIEEWASLIGNFKASCTYAGQNWLLVVDDLSLTAQSHSD